MLYGDNGVGIINILKEINDRDNKLDSINHYNEPVHGLRRP